jgi:hypothetical protein
MGLLCRMLKYVFAESMETVEKGYVDLLSAVAPSRKRFKVATNFKLTQPLTSIVNKYHLLQ